eukprot:CAMPEP_0185723814 /NCGR_PEP_ID=MMETSP1171-20130828/525_1 /TAXON_ID=374046 /ORGANISM="Helicotheca tamensis, Strain CCMP826" /LENGTH=154 /DNA_ID=CAMNT_0028391569 /DNA_START=79 /DNA_END=543 /DNA_ORIENTATION=+
MVRIASILLLAAGASAFTVGPSAPLATRSAVSSPTARFIMTEEETEAILKSAHDCHEGECTVDEIAGLIDDLEEQKKVLSERLEAIMNMVSQLQKANTDKQRKTEDVRAYVKDLLRVFSMEHPIVMPSGFSGDIGDGPQTAYDVLPPKPWKEEK